MDDLVDALEEEEQLRKIHFEKIDQSRAITQNAIIAIQEYKKKGNLEIERLSFSKKCSKLLKIHYETIEHSYLLFKKDLNNKFYQKDNNSSISKLIEDSSEIDMSNSKELTLSHYFLLEKDVEFEKIKFRASKVYLAVSKSSLQMQSETKKKKRSSANSFDFNKSIEKEEISTEENKKVIEKSEKLFLYVYQYLTNKVLVFFHHQIALLLQVNSHPLIKSISNFGYDKNSFTLFVEVPKKFYFPDKEEYLTFSEWREKKPSKETVFVFVKNLLKAFSHLHARSIAHGNFDENSIFVDKKTNIPYITNFEILCDKEGRENVINEKTPPELVKASSVYGPMCDIWTLGVIFFELFFQVDFQKKFVSESHFVPPHVFDFPYFDSLCDLLKKMLSFSPEHRISSFESLLHPLFDSPNSHFYQHVNRDSVLEIQIKIWEMKEIISKFSNLTSNFSFFFIHFSFFFFILNFSFFFYFFVFFLF